MSIAVASSGGQSQHSVGDLRSSLATRLLLCIVLGELVLLYAPTLRWLVQRWTMSVWHNAHGFLIPPVVGYFAWQELRRVRHWPAASSAWGFLFLVPALIVHVLDTGIHTQILSALSIVVALPGLALLFLGTARTKAIAFPLAFMAFMLPIPLTLTERLHFFLREIATVATAYVVPLLGISVYAEGTTLHLANGTLFVGDGCSGFSTLYAACAVAGLTAYSCDRWKGRILALAAAVPLAIGANILRVVLLTVIARWAGMHVLDTWIHPGSGLLTFAVSIPIIFWLGRPRPDGQAVRA